jgi:hypothetical protein
MRVRQVLVLATVMMALGACQSERRADVTGSYGSAVLAGKVVLDGIDGTPEGVVVSVRDTGMATTLTADGRFAFAGVPENAILDFRRADGIDASLAVNGSKGSITVELGRSGASKGKGRGNNTKDKREFEGVIRAASAEEITLFTSHQEEVVIGLTAETVIRRGNETLTPADLQPDMRVHVRARRGSEGTFTAQLIIVQNDGDDDDGEDDPPALRQFEGTIVTASATELVVFTSHKVEVTFALTAETVIRKGNTPVAPAGLLPGQRVHIKATVADGGAATAVEVIVQNTRASQVSVSGTVISVSGSDILVGTEDGEVTVQTDASTRIRKKGKTIGVGDLVAGDPISAKGTRVSDSVILATEVEVRGRSGHP